MHKVLQLDAVTKRFSSPGSGFGSHSVSRVALDGVSLAIQAGEVVALLGPNGAGKTTTLNLSLGFLTADQGVVRVGGQDVAADPIKARQHIAYLPEQVALYPGLSGLDNLRYFTLLAGEALTDTAMRKALLQAGLAAEAHDKPAGRYSKGMRQKVGIAIALARQVQLLLLDEPSSGLDPSASAELSTLINAASQRGIGVLMATHDLYRVKEVAHRVVILKQGRIAVELDPETLDHVALEQLYIEHLS